MTTTTNGSVAVIREEATYRPDGHSYFADLARARHPEHKRDEATWDRLRRHERELEQRAPNSTYADPPLWLIDRFATAPRPERVLLRLIEEAGNLIPIAAKPGFGSVSTIRLTTGTQTDINAPGTPAAERDYVEAAVPTGSTSGPAATTGTLGKGGGFANSPVTGDPRDPTTDASNVVLIAGNADVPLQMLEQSGPGQAHLDAVLWKDLTEDYDSQVEAQLISGSGGAGLGAQLLGLLNIPGTNAVTFTDASPTAAKFIQVQASATAGGSAPQALAAIGRLRKRKPEAWLMTTSRAAWIASSEVALPLALANQRGPGAFDLLAYPVTEDDSIPVNLTGNPGSLLPGGTQDVAIALRVSDLQVFESAPTMEAFSQTLAGTLEGRVQYRAHVAALLGRYPSGISIISGTGMAVQTALGF